MNLLSNQCLVSQHAPGGGLRLRATEADITQFLRFEVNVVLKFTGRVSIAIGGLRPAGCVLRVCGLRICGLRIAGGGLRAANRPERLRLTTRVMPR